MHFFLGALRVKTSFHPTLTIKYKDDQGSHIFRSPEPKAHGWANSIPITLASMVCPLIIHPSTVSNIFYSETTGPIFLTKVRSYGLGHKTKMAAMFETLLKISSRTRRPMTLRHGMEPLGALCAQMMILDWPWPI